MLLVLFPTLEAIVFRNILKQGTIWSQELTTMLYGIIFMIGGAYTESRKSHVQMDVIYIKYRGAFKIIVDTLIIIFCTIFCYVLVTRGGSTFLRVFRNMERSQTLWKPILWPYRLSIPLGVTLLWIRSLISYNDSILYLKNKEMVK